MKTDIKALIQFPVSFVALGIYDVGKHLIAQVCGWGRLQYLEDAEQKQDDIGEFIAQAINDKLKTL